MKKFALMFVMMLAFAGIAHAQSEDEEINLGREEARKLLKKYAEKHAKCKEDCPDEKKKEKKAEPSRKPSVAPRAAQKVEVIVKQVPAAPAPPQKVEVEVKQIPGDPQKVEVEVRQVPGPPQKVEVEVRQVDGAPRPVDQPSSKKDVRDLFKGWEPKYGASAFWGTDNFGGVAGNVELVRSEFALTFDLGWARLMNDRLSLAGVDNLNRILASAGVMYKLGKSDFRVGAHTTWIGRLDPHRSSARIYGGVIDYDFGRFKAVVNLDHNTIEPIRNRQRLEPVVAYGFVPSFALKASW